jgi:hypothetical protein
MAPCDTKQTLACIFRSEAHMEAVREGMMDVTGAVLDVDESKMERRRG